jgi:S-DNA-T family DNA segregation ATPase FtsK/SpoIIIE
MGGRGNGAPLSHDERDFACANLASFNEKVRAAQAKGKPLGRRVQIGFDPDTGEEMYEENQLDYEPLPQIVLIVDELADLMVTVGKEIEVLIQRLSQKSRAAGIHLIMATQRPRLTSSPASSRPTCRPASALP